MARARQGQLRHWRALLGRWFRPRRRTVKVYGLLRTGTNYVSALLGENLDVVILGPEKGGWKHGPIVSGTGVTAVVVVKSPYTWLDSFYRWEQLRQRTPARTLAQFVSSPVSHPELAQAWGARDPVDVWNKATASWLAAQDDGEVLVVRYEDVIGDLGRVLDRFTARFPTRRRHRHPVDIAERVGPGWRTVGPVDRERYRPDRPLEMDEDALALVRERLDSGLARNLGYGVGEEPAPRVS